MVDCTENKSPSRFIYLFFIIYEHFRSYEHSTIPNVYFSAFLMKCSYLSLTRSKHNVTKHVQLIQLLVSFLGANSDSYCTYSYYPAARSWFPPAAIMTPP